MTSFDCPMCEKLQAVGELPGEDVVWQFPHSVALLGTWQYFQGYCILVSRRHASELFHLDVNERQAYFEEMLVLAGSIARCFRPHKLNYELLGNQVPHLHWHLFPRYRDDPEHLHPVWLALHRAEKDAALRQRLQTGPTDRKATAELLRHELHLATKP